jgi:hypothetical protein
MILDSFSFPVATGTSHRPCGYAGILLFPVAGNTLGVHDLLWLQGSGLDHVLNASGLLWKNLMAEGAILQNGLMMTVVKVHVPAASAMKHHFAAICAILCKHRADQQTERKS